VWLDCDPGHDDMMAIIFAAYSEQIELLGISTVCGNQTADKTTSNALKTLELAHITGVDVVRGMDEGLCRPSRACPEIHGSTGLGGAELPAARQVALKENAILHMFNVISAPRAQKVSLLGTAQLTNIALLLRCFPEVKSHIEQIVVMGGAVGLGNMRPAAEWNIEGDPEAAHVVFNSGLRVVMIPIEVTHTVLVTKAILAEIKALGTKFAETIVSLMTFFGHTYDTVFRMPDPPLHDPCTVAFVISPEIFTVEHLHVEVELGSKCCDGRTNCDIFNMLKKPKNVFVARKVNVPQFWQLLLAALRKANDKCLPSS
jgi:inosine-uridine nucleoside N-ribohydrolase